MGSKTLKTVVGIAAVAVGLGFVGGAVGAWASTTAFTLGAATITYGSIASMVGLSILGSALAPEVPDMGDLAGVDSYSGQKLQTNKSNTAPVPVVYGKHRLGGNIIYQKTNTAINADSAAKGYNRDYWAIIAVAGHNINDITNIYAGEDALNSLGSNKYELAHVHIKWYDASATATSIQAVDFVINDTGTTNTGLTLGLDDLDIPANTAYLAVHQVFDGENNANTQMANVTIEIEGKKIRTITDASTISATETYTTNPAEVVLDLLGDGLSIPDSQIDIASFYDVKTKCNTNTWECNLALIQQANIQSTIQEVLSTFRGQIIHSENVWKLKADAKQQTSVATITEDDIVNNTLSISMKGSKDISNKIILKYIDPTDDWLAAQVVKEDSTLQTLDGQTLERTLDIKGITNATQAGTMAEITLNTMRYTEDALGVRIKQTPLVCSFATSVKNAHLEVGDVITLSHDLLDRDRKFMLLSVETDQSGLIQISAREYAETHYKDSSGTYLI